MYQTDNTNYRTNKSFAQEFSRSCLGRILIGGVILLIGLVVAYFTAPKEQDMDEEMLDNIMQCLEMNSKVRGDVVDDYVHNLAFIFTTADVNVIPKEVLTTYYKYNRMESYRHTFCSTTYIYNNMHPEGIRVGIGIFGIIIPTVLYEDILLDVDPVHKGYEQKLNQPVIKHLDNEPDDNPDLAVIHGEEDN